MIWSDAKVLVFPVFTGLKPAGEGKLNLYFVRKLYSVIDRQRVDFLSKNISERLHIH